MKQRWWKKGVVYIYLEGVRVALRLTEDFMESGTDTEAEDKGALGYVPMVLSC